MLSVVLASKSKLSGGLPQDSFQVDVLEGGYGKTQGGLWQAHIKPSHKRDAYGLDNSRSGIKDSVPSSRIRSMYKVYMVRPPFKRPLRYQGIGACLHLVWKVQTKTFRSLY